ncbi:hypothetical protein [Kribbella italica]|uniref:Uncharacterized protein n=1 Tax=Kribbella italica TaxID=1540520 RepID=A0A7W9JC73_9ACTN|nr:hypothetical protein [Kribbella italica]MBB5838753.1 hypothetical protein [Kribbella italica]
MAGRFVGGVLLGAGLLVITLAGGAGGYGIGQLTEPRAQSTESAAPLGPSAEVTPTEPLNVAVKDPTPALKKSELRYKEREFVAKKTVRSQVTVEVPKDWHLTLSADPQDQARFTDPTGRRFVRVQAGFTIERPPAASMAERIGQLDGTPYRQDLRIVSERVAEDKRSATLIYTYVPDPEKVLRYVVVRWVALDGSGNCAVEIAVSGLNQDKEAIPAVLERAADSVTRSDSSL